MERKRKDYIDQYLERHTERDSEPKKVLREARTNAERRLGTYDSGETTSAATETERQSANAIKAVGDLVNTFATIGSSGKSSKSS